MTQVDRVCLALYLWGMVIVEGLPLIVGTFKFNSPIFMAMAMFIIFAKFRSFSANLYVLFVIPVLFFSLYSAYIFLSFSWSHVGLDSSFQALPIILMVLSSAALAKLPIEQTIPTFVRTVVVVCLLSWIVGVIVPSVGAVVPPGWRLNGITIHPQRLALMVIAALLLIVLAHYSGLRHFRSNRSMAATILVLVATLLAAQTRAFTTYGAVAIGLVIFIFASGRIRAVLVTVAAYVGLAVLLNPELLETLYEREGTNNETLSGRTTIWSSTARLAQERFWEGHGFASFLSGLTQNFFRNYIAPHAHNDVLNVWFETGVIGVCLLGFFFVSSMYFLFRKRVLYSGYLMVLFAMCGLTGSIFGAKLSLPMGLVMMLLMQELASRRHSARSQQRTGALPLAA